MDVTRRDVPPRHVVHRMEQGADSSEHKFISRQ
jgi:hypothetical protein